MRTLFKGWLDHEQRSGPDPEATWVSINRRLGAAADHPPAWVLAALSAAVAVAVYAAWPTTPGEEAPRTPAQPEVSVAPPAPPARPPAVRTPPASVVVAIPASPPEPGVAKGDDYQGRLRRIFKSGDLVAMRAEAGAHVAESDESRQFRNELGEFAGLYPQVEANPVAVGWAVWLDRRLSGSLGAFTNPLKTTLLNWHFKLAEEAARNADWITVYQVLGFTCEHLLSTRCPSPWPESQTKAQERYLDAYESLFTDPVRARVKLEEVLDMTPELDDTHRKAAVRIKELIATGSLEARTLEHATAAISAVCPGDPNGRRCQEAHALQGVFARELNARSRAAVLDSPQSAQFLAAEVISVVGDQDPEGQLAAHQLQQLNALAPAAARTSPR